MPQSQQLKNWAKYFYNSLALTLKMSDYLVHRDKSLQQYEIAFHLLQVTFPLVKDPKLLIGIINNLFASLEHSLDTILNYEKQLMLVSTCSGDFTSKFNLFRSKSVLRNKIPADYVNLIIDLREILEMHKKSPMEFQRGNRLVICTKDYRLKMISLKDIKSYLDRTKSFLNLVDFIIKR